MSQQTERLRRSTLRRGIVLVLHAFLARGSQDSWNSAGDVSAGRAIDKLLERAAGDLPLQHSDLAVATIGKCGNLPTSPGARPSAPSSLRSSVDLRPSPSPVAERAETTFSPVAERVETTPAPVAERAVSTPPPVAERAEGAPETVNASDVHPAQAGLDGVRSRVRSIAAEAGLPQPPRLVAVSKTKPVEMLMACYDAGQRDFGENYVNEIVNKSGYMPSDTRWRFIGHLQSDKSNQLVTGVPSLACVESVDSKKLADKLNSACLRANRSAQLGVMVQVDTSGEESKNGLTPGEEVIDVAKHIVELCPRLRLEGLMTIGAAGDYSAFDKLKTCRDDVASALQVESHSLELSMGMSNDFEEAMRHGSTNVRVGSAIFGARVYPAKPAQA